jgi:hypothetical protein
MQLRNCVQQRIRKVAPNHRRQGQSFGGRDSEPTLGPTYLDNTIDLLGCCHAFEGIDAEIVTGKIALDVMLDGRVAAFRCRGVALPSPVVVADSWFSDAKLMCHVATTHQGTVFVEGKTAYVFVLPDGRQVKGHDLHKPGDWP